MNTSHYLTYGKSMIQFSRESRTSSWLGAKILQGLIPFWTIQSYSRRHKFLSNLKKSRIYPWGCFHYFLVKDRWKNHIPWVMNGKSQRTFGMRSCPNITKNPRNGEASCGNIWIPKWRLKIRWPSEILYIQMIIIAINKLLKSIIKNWKSNKNQRKSTTKECKQAMKRRRR